MKTILIAATILLIAVLIFLFWPVKTVSEPRVSVSSFSIIQNNSLVAISPVSFPDIRVLSSLMKERVPLIRDVTAYNAVEEQTDSEPCIAYGGFDVCKALDENRFIAASNEFEIGQLIYIPYLDRIYEIRDRMHERYPYRIDLLFESREEAVSWGLKALEIYPL